MRLKVSILFLFLFWAVNICVQAQRPNRPLPNQGQQVPPGAARERQLVEPGQEGQAEQEGRRKLIDDSTKMVFGPKTSLYFFEKDVKKNRIKKYEIDTVLNNFHYYEPVAKSGWMYQDLGNVGSAAIPIFYEAPRMIGVTSGFHVYDLYYNSSDSIKYYDTKSPFSQMNAFWGGGNRNLLDLVFSRNVNSRWNVGFNLSTIRARKTLNPNARDDNLTEQNSYSFHTNYRSENEKYFLLANFSRMKHRVREQGGIVPPEIDENSILFAYEDAKVWLRNSRVTDLRQEVHLYHEYELVKGWQIYHVFDRKKQEVLFFSNLNTADSLFFNLFNPERFNDNDTTLNLNTFREWRNEAGFKGEIGPLYYNAFLRFRTGGMSSPNFESTNRFNELFVGGALRGQINEQWSFEAEGEYLIPGAFRIKGLFVSPWLEASYTKALYKPTSMQMMYAGNHHQWENDFSNIGLDQIKGVVKLDFSSWAFRPNLTINRVNNFVYFNEQQQASQATGEAFMLIPGVKSMFNLRKKLFWESEAYYTLLSGAGADNFRIPELVLNSRIYFDSPMFNENLFVQIGVEGRYRSDNFAFNYNPAMQQFFLQNEFNVFAYPVIDFFLNARINRTRVLLRMNHLNMNMLSQPGYFVTPYFTGLRRSLDIGISWPLFD
ncbi:putative porin [Cecembia calidifontis]|uniref:Putative beta-barrel porin n=1 Tax=Cecembia calidifontis TaxID=1187080 RepID=A0A4Q7PC27_9BACT|nr:putative porin [Cecembia calidifontis]RZS96342.1 putative beta-barrel porin [Cecembia calidifontis]